MLPVPSLMGAFLGLARIAGLILVLVAAPAAQAAFYDTKSFFISALVAHDVIDPQTLNGDLHNDAPLRAFFSGRLRGERGLVAPFLTHWIEVGGGYAWSSGQGTITGVGFRSLEQTLMYFWGIPAGVTWWFLRTSFVDLGLGAGIGVGFLPQHNQRVFDANSGTVNRDRTTTGSAGVILDGGLQGRLWISKYFGIDMSGGLRYFGVGMSNPDDSLFANLYSINVTVGATFAFGGVRGTGRAQVEVLKPGKKPPASLPAGSQLPPTPPPPPSTPIRR